MQTEFAKILATRLLQSKGRNPSYSLRSFAKQIGMSHSAVSEILSGKRRLSYKKMIQIALRLGLSESQIKDFEQKSPIEMRRNTTQIDLDQFAMISGSIPFALLSLMETETFCSDISWMAKRLGVSKRVIVDSLKRLERLEMVGRDADGQYACTQRGTESSRY
ncbi:MAG: DUF4423 domain-containing protein [Proteobacteria bacterium]|nr:DUF4423 domain-containing protein [Pseudomonadota bacterium]